jgi:G:T-mismatch repair DNA endonuclease (very short patch repair protein)
MVLIEKLYMNEEWLRSKIEKEGLTYKQTADLCGAELHNVSYWAQKYGIKRPGSTKRNLETAAMCKDREWLYHQYIVLDKSYDDISDEFGIGKTTIGRWVKRYGLEKPGVPYTRRKNFRPSVTKNCLYCGAEMKVKASVNEEGNGKFCSRSCSAKYNMEHADLKNKLSEGHRRFFETEEGKLKRIEMGIKGCLAAREGHETYIEKTIREVLDRIGVVYESQKPMYYWVCDFYLPDYDLVIEVMGDYWHCNPSIYKEPDQIQRRNIRRDKGKRAYLQKCGHRYLELWESDINNQIPLCIYQIYRAINASSTGRKEVS